MGHDELCLPFRGCMHNHVTVLHLEAFAVLFLASGLLAVAAPLMLSDWAILGLHIAGHLSFKGLQERRAWCQNDPMKQFAHVDHVPDCSQVCISQWWSAKCTSDFGNIQHQWHILLALNS